MSSNLPIVYSPNNWLRFEADTPKSGDDRSQGEIDRSRILHSASFRRLQGKTQIFGGAQDSFYRQRLTHSLEVAQIAKGIAIKVGADASACEAVSLAHDIGHPPFGHRGESILGELMESFGGFEANAQNIRVLGFLEIKSQQYDGLNLSKTVLDGLLKYREPYDGQRKKFYYVDDPRLRDMVEWAMSDGPGKPLECQIMDWADDIAYSVHDLEDGIHSGLITSGRALKLADEILKHAQGKHSSCSSQDVYNAITDIEACEHASSEKAFQGMLKELTSRLINTFIGPLRVKSKANVSSRSIRHQVDLDVDDSLRRQCQALKSLAFLLIVDDHRVASLEARAHHILNSLFRFYAARETQDLSGARLVDGVGRVAVAYPEPFRTYFLDQTSEEGRARVACDFIAGMTDEYAERVFSRIFTGSRSALSDY